MRTAFVRGALGLLITASSLGVNQVPLAEAHSQCLIRVVLWKIGSFGSGQTPQQETHDWSFYVQARIHKTGEQSGDTPISYGVIRAPKTGVTGSSITYRNPNAPYDNRRPQHPRIIHETYFGPRDNTTVEVFVDLLALEEDGNNLDGLPREPRRFKPNERPNQWSDPGELDDVAVSTSPGESRLAHFDRTETLNIEPVVYVEEDERQPDGRGRVDLIYARTTIFVNP
jgi:hypothetical protein